MQPVLLLSSTDIFLSSKCIRSALIHTDSRKQPQLCKLSPTLTKILVHSCVLITKETASDVNRSNNLNCRGLYFSLIRHLFYYRTIKYDLIRFRYDAIVGHVAFFFLVNTVLMFLFPIS